MKPSGMMIFKKTIQKKAWCATTAVLISLSATNAQRGAIDYPEYHYLTISAGGGYTNLLTDIDNVTNPGSGGALLGIGYEYRAKMFWTSVGVQGSLINSSLRSSADTVIHRPMYDQEGEAMTFNYMADRWVDEQMMLDVDIPFMLGFRKDAFYMGVGVKAGFNIYGQARSSLKYRTSTTYDRFPDDFVNMPNHWNDEFRTKGVNPLHFGLNVAALLEVGAEVMNLKGDKGRLPMRLKVGAYAEYGFLSVYRNTEVSDILVYDDVNPAIVTPASFYTATEITRPVNPLMAGIKLTLMFEMPVPQRCNCLQTEEGASWRNKAPRETRRQNKRVRKAIQKERNNK